MGRVDTFKRWLRILSSLDNTEPNDLRMLDEACGANANGPTTSQEQKLELLFSEFFSSHPDHKTALRNKLIHESLQVVDDAMDHYRQIKAQRPLTDEEKQVGPVLLDLMSASRRLLHAR